MNRIGDIQFHFTMRNETFAKELYGRWDRFFRTTLEPVADALLHTFNKEDEEIVIDLLQLDLGTITEQEFDELFPALFREKLEEALGVTREGRGRIRTSRLTGKNRGENRPLYDPASGTETFTVYSSAGHLFEILKWFLLHGTLPWYTDPSYKNIPFLFMEVIRKNGKELKHFLQTYGHYTSLQERLVYQLNDPELEQGVRLFSPSESVFIVSYIQFLVSKYKTITRPRVRETTYRHTVWRVVYAYLLTSRSSWFNKKAFVMSTIATLGSAINITYNELLDLLTDEIEKLAQATLVSVELYRLLSELKEEATGNRFRTIAADAAKLYKALEEIFRADMTQQLAGADKDALMTILSGPTTCRTFLQLLKEEEILRLVPVVIPNESKFVILYARSLDRQKEQGYLAGKAGNEFTKLKWQFIFPLLFENRGSRLNRTWFVYAVIKQIAAHYNLSFTDLLGYFNQQKTLLFPDKELKEIIGTLYEEMVSGSEKPDIPHVTEDLSLSGYLKHNKEITSRQKKEIFRKLSVPLQRRLTLEKCSEEEQKQLIRLFFRQESEFILSYAFSLEKQEATRRMEGKTGRSFRQLKWEFIWAVMTKDDPVLFNRRYFISDVLKKMSAHYNLRYIELLSYFCNESSLRLFTYEIQKILQSLFRDEVIRLIRQSGTLLKSSNKRSLLILLVQSGAGAGKDSSSLADIIMNYLQFLQECKEAGLFPHVSPSAFNSIVWKQTIILLLAESRNDFDKKQFIKQLFEKLAKHFQLSVRMFIREIQQNRECLKSIPNEIHTIVTGIMQPAENSAGKVTGTQAGPIHINNGGVVLLSPWLPRLYSLLDLTKDNIFRNEEAQIKAIYLIQYAVFGHTHFPEYELILNKILVGLPTDTPVPAFWDLTEQEKETIRSMLEGVRQNWPGLKNSSVAALQETFLQREGMLEIKYDHYRLTMEEKAFDLLIDDIPWNFRMIRQTWMEKRIEVKWR